MELFIVFQFQLDLCFVSLIEAGIIILAVTDDAVIYYGDRIPPSHKKARIRRFT